MNKRNRNLALFGGVLFASVAIYIFINVNTLTTPSVEDSAPGQLRFIADCVDVLSEEGLNMIPESDSKLHDLLSDTKGELFSSLSFAIVDGHVVDAWRRPVQMKVIDSVFTVRSAGADHIFDTKDDITATRKLIKKAPNKAVEPTTMRVTDPANAGSAPRMVAAHF